MVDAEASRRPEAEDLITDWYLPESDPMKGFVYPGPVPIADHPRLFTMAADLLKRSIAKTVDGYEEFVIKAGDRTYRGHRIGTIEGYVFALRRLPDTIPSLDKLGMEPAIRTILMDSALSKGGLILVCGETGQGKSTTCAATVKERMQHHGSFCLTVEDPPEMPLHGVHGKGRCMQTEVKSGAWAEAMKGAMRCYPTVSGSMLYVGETRDPETAAEVLRVATNGHLVLTTLHAQDLESAIKRYVGLAMASGMPPEEVKSILASSFRLALHQRLEMEPGKDGKPGRRKLKVSFLFSPNSRSPVAQKLRSPTGDSLNNEIRTQEMLLRSQGSKALLDAWKG